MFEARPLTDIRRDQRGAVMLTGLFMSCFLIGALWFVVGVGDALVYRDRMQEATDHGAFAAAALNAKGMNFISLCNLVLLTAVTVHVILGLIHDIALALCVVSSATTCGHFTSIRALWTSYFEQLKPAARAIHNATKTGSYGFPIMGLAEGLNVGKAYSRARSAGAEITNLTQGADSATVIALSPSMLKGASFSSVLGAEKKEGLTLENRPMSLVCRRISSTPLDSLLKIARGAAGGGGLVGRASDLVKTIVGDSVENRYCNDMSTKESVDVRERVSDFVKQEKQKLPGRVKKRLKRVDDLFDEGSNDEADRSTDGATPRWGRGRGGLDPGLDAFWGENGPMTVIGPAKNGNDWFQSYSVNLNPQLRDASESRVGFGRGPKSATTYEAKVSPKGGIYLAQAEYFFDCNTKWSNAGCNFEESSAFAIKWRARLRRFSVPQFRNLLGTVGGQLASSVPRYAQFDKLRAKLDPTTALFGSKGIATMSSVREFLGNAGGLAERTLGNEISDEVEHRVDGALKTPPSVIPDIPFH